MSDSQQMKGIILIIAGAFCFSTSGFTQAMAPEGATPYVVGALRMLIAGLALFLWCARRKMLPQQGGWPLKNMTLAISGLTLCQFFFFQGLLVTGVAVGTVVTLGFAPIAAALLGWIFLEEKPIRAWYPATALAIFGLIYLNWAGSGEINPLKILPSLLAGFSYALYLVSSKPLTQSNPPETVMMLICLISGLCMLPTFIFYPIDWVFTSCGILVALNLGVVTSAMAFTLTLAGLRTVPTCTASTLGLIEPLSAAALGFIALGEPVNTFSIIGLSCILGSALLLTFFSTRKSDLRVAEVI